MGKSRTDRMGRLAGAAHHQRGDTVLQYSKPSMGGGVANRYNPAVWQPGKPLTEGYIALQSEGQPISFRNLFLKELK